MKKRSIAAITSLFLWMGCADTEYQPVNFADFLLTSLGDSIPTLTAYAQQATLRDIYLFPTVESLLDKEALLANYPDSAIYYQDLATKLSYLGLTEASLTIWRTSSDLNLVSLDLDRFGVVPPAEWLTRIPDSCGTLMFNEAHHIPAHRATVLHLLPELYQLGYRKLGLETLKAADQYRLNDERFPLKSSGTYVLDPIYANMVRVALRLGFRVFAYEDPNLGGAGDREAIQAGNLWRMDTSYQGKLLVLAGYGHIREQPVGNWRAMAAHFAALAGHDPYTVDQTAITEQDLAAYPVVPMQEDQPVVTGKYRGYVDAQIVYPTNYLLRDDHYLSDHDYFRNLEIPPPGPNAVLQQTYAVHEADRYELERLIPLDQNLTHERREHHVVPTWYQEFWYVERDIFGRVIKKVLLKGG